eukprot:12734-Heterococcus_DN1.PRE.2
MNGQEAEAFRVAKICTQAFTAAVLTVHARLCVAAFIAHITYTGSHAARRTALTHLTHTSNSTQQQRRCYILLCYASIHTSSIQLQQQSVSAKLAVCWALHGL